MNSRSWPFADMIKSHLRMAFLWVSPSSEDDCYLPGAVIHWVYNNVHI